MASSRGRGIKLVPEPATIPADKACLMQHYISNPHTIHGLKVSTFNPKKPKEKKRKEKRAKEKKRKKKKQIEKTKDMSSP